MSLAYYNEIDPYAAQWLRNLIDAGHIAPGVVDTRSIVDVRPSDLDGFTQCHFFAGIGGWSLAARLAGWPDDRPLWSGSAPCQPFSVAGKGKAQADDRHLWPYMFQLIRSCRPAAFVGEQVAAAVGKDWLDGVFADLEGIDYACGAAVVPACAIDAPHRRDRLWFVAHADDMHAQGIESSGIDAEIGRLARERSIGPLHLGDGAVGHANESRTGKGWEQRGGELSGARGDSEARAGVVADAYGVARGQGGTLDCRRDQRSNAQSWSGPSCDGSFWQHATRIIGHDGKARRVEPGIRLLAHGVPARVGRLRAYGNAIVPQVAAEVIGALMDCDVRSAA